MRLIENFPSVCLRPGCQKPTLKIKYQKLNENLEKASNVINFVLLKIVLVFTLMPALFSTMINCFAYDLNNAAYVLPFPIMYVRVINT